MKAKLKRAFTLIEMIVVIGVSSILFGIIAIPLVQGFNLTRTSQAYAEAQHTARSVNDQVIGDISQAASVLFYYTQQGGLNLDLPAPYFTTNFIGVKLDLLMPAQGNPATGPGGAFINPNTGKADPTLGAPKGQINLPAAPGMSLVRYWVGLRDPLHDPDGDGVMENRPYNDPYSNLLMPRNAQQDNLYVLYRAEVQPKVFANVLGRFVPNTAFFADDDGDGEPDLSDPDFFRISGTEPDAAAKIVRISNWQRRGKIITALSRYDMLQVKFNPQTRLAYTDSRAGIVPLIRFQPRIISQESATASKNQRPGEETDNPMKVGPEAYRTVFGLWTGSRFTVFPSFYSAPVMFGSGSSGGFVRPPLNAPYPRLEAVARTDGGDGFINSVLLPGGDRVALFDMDLYKATEGTAADYRFTQALASADNENALRGVPGRTSAGHVDQLVAFMPDFDAGELHMTFDVRDVGSDVTFPYDRFTNRVPSNGPDPGVDIGDPETPNSDPNIALPGTPWSAADTGRTINNRFNNLWERWPDFAPGFDRARYVKRYVDLAHVAQPGGDPSPLSRLNGMTRASMTPGSEVVYGPDQRPGQSYGAYVRYTRVASRPVGPNQYYINYTDQQEPDWLGLFGSAASYDPKVYDANDFVSSVLQPPFRAGYLELNSRFGEPLPAGNIFVSYRFQFTETTDRMVVDYNTAESMEVVLTIKNFPQSPVPFAQTVTVKGTTQVRNFFR